jgi:dethiobiotin synthetase
MPASLFITGTDTHCGKTYVACALIRALRAQGVRVAPYKPVAAGAECVNGALRNEDALQLMAAAGGDWPYAAVNPYCLPNPVSPHLAARDAGVDIDPEVILQGAGRLADQADCLIVEGAGGWLVPLANDLDIADIALALKLPVVLVVGLRLGCLNHARLSAQAIEQTGAPVVGWIGSQIETAMPHLGDNLETLRQCLPMPYLGFLPSHAQPGDIDVLAADMLRRMAHSALR